MEVQVPEVFKKPLLVPNKTLMGSGPSNATRRVLDSMSNPLLAECHPECLQIMDEIQEGIKYLFQTQNPATMCISGSGHAGMEAAMCNLLEDGEVALFGVTGLWGNRAGDMAQRYGADVRYVRAKYGYALSFEEIREAFQVHNPKVFFIAQGDSSTGVNQGFIADIGELCRRFNCLLVVDTVASLGSIEFLMDEWKVDVAYTGSQKVLCGPAGITPISFNQRALNKIKARQSKIKSYYFDITLIGQFWGCFGSSRIYHHTVSSTLLYGLREAIAIICQQGLKNMIRRHIECSYRLQKGIENMGLEMFVPEPNQRMSSINAVRIPNGVDWRRVSQYAMNKYFLEIAGGLGPTVDQVFRIGLLGENATEEKVDLVLTILREAIQNTSGITLNERSKI